MSTYATVDQLTARLSSAYSVPDDAAQLLDKASEIIDYECLGRVEKTWNDPNAAQYLKDAITKATCDQVEYWLEIGEETDVAGLAGAMTVGRVQITSRPPVLGQRARRDLLAAGLYWAGAGAL